MPHHRSPGERRKGPRQITTRGHFAECAERAGRTRGTTACPRHANWRRTGNSMCTPGRPARTQDCRFAAPSPPRSVPAPVQKCARVCPRQARSVSVPGQDFLHLTTSVRAGPSSPAPGEVRLCLAKSAPPSLPAPGQDCRGRDCPRLFKSVRLRATPCVPAQACPRLAKPDGVRPCLARVCPWQGSVRVWPSLPVPGQACPCLATLDAPVDAPPPWERESTRSGW